MPESTLFRLALATGSAVASLSAGAVLAPGAHADEKRTPPGLTSLPPTSNASMHAVPLPDPHGRKLR